MRHTITSASIFVVAVSLLSGCSFLFVDAPPANHAERAYFACTSSRMGPILDGVVTVAAAITLGNQLLADQPDRIEGGAAATLITLGAAALFGASTVDGFITAEQCRTALEEAKTRRDSVALAPSPVIRPTADTALACTDHNQCRPGRLCAGGVCINATLPTTTTPDVTQPAQPQPDPQPTDAAPPVPVLLFSEPPQDSASGAPPTSPPPTSP